MRVPLLLFFLLLAIAEGSAQTSRIEIISERSSTLDFGGNADSGAPAVSADGRFILFSSTAENLTTGNTKHPVADIYLHDRQANETRLITLATNGTTSADDHCWNPQISSDGSKIMFETAARNLMPTMTNGIAGVLVYDLASTAIWHASVGLNGTNASAPARNALLSADGSMVVFESAAINLTTGITYRTPATPHVFVRNLASNRTELVDVNYRNLEPARSGVTSFSSIVGVSSNGTKVAFLSNGTNFVQVFSQTYRSNNLWVRDLILGTNILVSSFNNQPSLFDIRSPSMSADGTKFIYSNGRTNFFRDINEASAVPLTLPSSIAGLLKISPDGELAAYYRFVAPEGGTSLPDNWGPKIFVGRVTDSPFVEVPIFASNGEFVFSADSQTIVVSTFGEDFERVVMVGGRQIRIKSAMTFAAPTLSADGTIVATEWRSSSNAYLNVFVEETNRTALISRALSTNHAPVEPTQHSEAISNDGNFILFTSFASLVLEDQNLSQDVYLRDRVAGTNLLVSRALNGEAGSHGSFMPRMTPNAEHVIFASAATNLVTGDKNRSIDVFVWNRSNQTVRLVSATPTGIATSSVVSAFSWPVISDDGRYSAFTSRRRDLVPGVLRSEAVYLRDLENEVTVPAFPTNLTSSTWARTVAVLDGPIVYYFERTNLVSFDVRVKTTRVYTNTVVDPFFSADGNRIAVLSRIGGVTRVDVYDTTTGSGREIYRYPGSIQPGLEYSISLSGDGKRLAFVTGEALVSEDVNETNDVYVAEVDDPGVFRLIKPEAGRASLKVRSAYPSMSDDGRRVTFVSKGTEWSPRALLLEPRVYMYDLPLRRAEHVSAGGNINSYLGHGYSGPMILPNGLGVVFGTMQSLASRDLNRSPDAYFAEFSMAPMVDADADELPDSWEQSEFGGLSEGPNGDFDGDGQSNRSEYIAGTDPGSSGSLLALEVFEETGSGLKLRWPIVEGKVYQVHFKRTVEGDWQQLTEGYSVVNGLAELNVEADEQAGFFRIQVNE